MIGNKEKLKKRSFSNQFITLFYYDDDDTLLFIVDTPVV